MIVKLKDVCTKIGSGATPKGGNNAYIDEGISLIRSQNILDFAFSHDGLAHINEEQATKLHGVTIEEDDVLLNITGDSVARACMVDNAVLPARVNQHVCIVRGDRTQILSTYILYFLQMKKPELLMMASSGATRNALTKGMIEELEIELPSLEKQKKLVSLIDSIQGKILINNRINRNLLEQLSTLYDELSTRKDWEYVTIGDLAEKIAMGPFGSNIKVSTFVPEGIPIISGNHLRGYFLEEPSYNYITEEHAGKLKNSNVYPKDVIFTHAGNIGQVAMIPDGCEYERYVISQRQFYLRCNTEKVLPEYVTLFFHSDAGQHELLSYANQVGVPSIAQPATNLKKIQIPLPPIEIQREWLQIVAPMIDIYQKNNLENKRLVCMRDTLLPKLMSGELDVSELDI